MEFSAVFSHTLCKKWDRGDHEGTTLLWSGRVGKYFGVCPESLCSTDTSLPKEKFENPIISPLAFETAKKFRNIAYWRIRNIEEYKEWIYELNGAVVGFDMCTGIYEAPNGLLPYPDKDEIIGGHAVLLVGYSEERRAFRFMNSWGKEWGDRGYGWMPYEYFEQNCIRQTWNPIRAFRGRVKILNREKIVVNKRKIIIVLKSYQSLVSRSRNLIIIEAYNRRNDLLGWIIFSLADLQVEVEDIFVPPDHRHKGFGSALVRKLFRIVRGYAVERIVAYLNNEDIIYNGDVVAEKFMQKHGFVFTQKDVYPGCRGVFETDLPNK